MARVRIYSIRCVWSGANGFVSVRAPKPVGFVGTGTANRNRRRVLGFRFSKLEEIVAAISKNTLQALEVLAELDQAGMSDKSHVIVVRPHNVMQFRRMLRMFAKDREWFPRLITAADGEMMFVRLKEISRVQVLERTLETVLPCIDDENLYDDVMEVLYGKR